MKIKRFDSLEQLEEFVNKNDVDVVDIKIIEQYDRYTAEGNPMYGQICNYWFENILIYNINLTEQ
jgi:hypothetical protein